jgi:hypothetical protein
VGVSDRVKHAGEILALEDQLSDLRKELTTAQRAASKRARHTAELVEAVYAAVTSASIAHGPAAKITAPKLAKSGGREESALLHLTDWQLGKKSVSFGVSTCEARIHQAVTKTVELTDIQRKHHPVTHCHVMLGGDMVEGVGIFPGQAFEIEAHLYEQLISCSRLIESAVAGLLENFATVHVWEEIGNHGRLGRKGEYPHGDNIDRIAYTIAREALVKRVPASRLVWHPWGGDIGTHVSIGNYTAFLFHGDEIKSFGGNTPAFGILRKLNAWASGVIDPFIDAYGGHFHTPMTLTMANAGRIFMTGSPESDNGYAKEFVAAVGKPSQRLHFVDPDKGRVTSEHVLWLD